MPPDPADAARDVARDLGPDRAAAPDACAATAEVCNGKDDDCNDKIDDRPGICPQPVVDWRGHAYMFVPVESSWPMARQACARYGYHLVTIDDPMENAFLVASGMQRSAANAWWIGFSDRQREGVWVWVGRRLSRAFPQLGAR